MTTTNRTLAMVSLMAWAACSSSGRREPSGGSASGITGPSDGSGIATGIGDGMADATADDGPGNDSNDTGLKFDTPVGGSGGPDEGGGQDGCEKIDFLFMIDSSGSMADEQQNLSNSFPGFIDVIQQTLMAQDYHILVADSDAAGFEICTTLCQFLPDCNGVPCGAIPPQDTCDNTLGAGKIKDQNGTACGVQGGQRYLVDGQPDVGGTFGCMALVGTQGSGDEMMIEAMQAAVSGPLNQAGGCNEGFLRDDAILVVTIITDESSEADQEGETPTPGTPADWYDTMVAAKDGDAEAVVMLGLIGDTGEPNAVCAPLDENAGTGAEPAPRLREFVELFGNYGVLGSVCEPDYAPFFASAVGVIDTACDEFEPPG